MAHGTLHQLTPNNRRRTNAPTDWTWASLALLLLVLLGMALFS